MSESVRSREGHVGHVGRYDAEVVGFGHGCISKA